jgi:hypothetical protein
MEWIERGLGIKMSSREFEEFARICEAGYQKAWDLGITTGQRGYGGKVQ